MTGNRPIGTLKTVAASTAAAAVAIALAASISCMGTPRAGHHATGEGGLAQLLVDARNANAAHDIDLERELLEAAEDLDGKDRDRADVQFRLAVLDWKYHDRFDAARRRLTAATTGPAPAKAWLALARMEQNAEDYGAAFSGAQNALAAATDSTDRRAARLAIIDATVEKAVVARLAGRSGIDAALRDGFAEATKLVRDEPGQLQASRRMLQAALLLEEDDAALLAWNSYFNAGPDGAMPNAVAAAGRRLAVLLPEGSDRTAITLALADSRFYREAAIVARDPETVAATTDKRVREALAYADFLVRVRADTREYYRKTSIGKGSIRSFRRTLRDEARRLVDEAGLTDTYGSAATVDTLQELIRDRFGGLFNLGRTAGYQDLHFGHIVVDQRRTVEQYGHTARVRFIQLDNIVSNGFQSWAWESGAQHGGWGGSTEIVQIRPAYLGEPQSAWRLLNDEEAHDRLLEEIDELTAGDEQRAAEDPFGFLPGLSRRLQYQGGTALFARLQASGLEDDALRSAFVNELQRVVQESSIFAHEGRHAIDAAGAEPSASGWRSEFNAKLSEIAFAPEPRLAMGGVFSPTIGDSSPHGRANSKIMKGLVAWMEEHRSEVEGLDDERPSLLQFDLLSDDQIQRAFRSMDSLAGGKT